MIYIVIFFLNRKGIFSAKSHNSSFLYFCLYYINHIISFRSSLSLWDSCNFFLNFFFFFSIKNEKSGFVSNFILLPEKIGLFLKPQRLIVTTNLRRLNEILLCVFFFIFASSFFLSVLFACNWIRVLTS